MALTRGTTGNAKPRVFDTPSTTATTKKKRAPGSGRPKGVSKKKAPATKRKPSVKDKVEGHVEKMVGKVEKKPGKEAAGTKKIKGTSGKGARGRPAKTAVAV